MGIINSLANHFSLTNAWIITIPVWLLGIFISRLNKKGMKRATDMSWYTAMDKISSFGSLFLMISYLLVSIYIPIKTNNIFFIIGIIFIIIFTFVHYSAKITYSKTDENCPASTGIYKISRNPMYFSLSFVFLGVIFITQSPLLLIIWIIMSIFTHILIIGEEKYCISKYGNTYIQYIKTVPRYILFF